MPMMTDACIYIDDWSLQYVLSDLFRADVYLWKKYSWGSTEDNEDSNQTTIIHDWQ